MMENVAKQVNSSAQIVGELGKGFAVVAEEVRKLAEQSGNAADNITKLITTIQQDTASAVESIKQSTQHVKDGRQAVAQTGEAFRGIESEIDTLNVNVAASMEHIKIANQSNEIAGSISAATQEQTATMQEVAKTPAEHLPNLPTTCRAKLLNSSCDV